MARRGRNRVDDRLIALEAAAAERVSQRLAAERRLRRNFYERMNAERVELGLAEPEPAPSAIANLVIPTAESPAPAMVAEKERAPVPKECGPKKPERGVLRDYRGRSDYPHKWLEPEHV